ncbi:MAG: hypothetical protein ABIJ05_01125 [Patescibacteria group bacterium]
MGGRIKSAKISLCLLYNLSDELITSPSCESALEVLKDFSKIRKDPPFEIRSAFFPKCTKKIVSSFLRSSPALLRPILKTDQGPAGNFLGMRISNERNMNSVHIQEIGGMAIPEIYFLNNIEQLKKTADIKSNIIEVQNSFESGEENEAFLAHERFQMECEKLGIKSEREANVGRESFFFIRPVSGKELVKVPINLAKKIEERVIKKVHFVESLAALTQLYFSKGYSLSEAKKLATNNPQLTDFNTCNASHFQADVILRENGSFTIDEIHFPDVGLFLTEIASNNEIFRPIQQVVQEIKPYVIKSLLSIIQKYKNSDVAILIRSSVIEREEDTLEILEIKALKDSLQEENVKVRVFGMNSVEQIRKGSVVIPLNLNTNETGYLSLLKRVSNEELICTTNPFILLFREELTELEKTELFGNNLANFINLTSSIESNNNLALMQYLAVQQTLDNIGVNSGNDILYFSGPNLNGRIPVFRHDIRGFQIASKIISDRVDQSSTVNIHSLSFKPEDAMVIGEDGPRLAAFRFMFTSDK